MSGVVLVLLVGAAAVALAWWFGAQRRKTLEAWAARHGLAFSPGRDASFDERYRAFHCLRRGHSRAAYNIARGAWGAYRVTTFDYRYVTGSGKNRQTHTFSAALVQASVPLKPLELRPEGIFDKVTEFFGLDDIDFESAEFSRTFHVNSPDRRWAYDVLHQRTIEFLLSQPRFSMQFDSDSVLVWNGRRFSGTDFDAAIGTAVGVLDRLPAYLLEQQHGRT